MKFEDALVAANAPRASAYRAWSGDESPDGPQVRFHDALAAQLLREQPGGGGTAFGDGQSIVDQTLAITEAAVTEVLERMGDIGPFEKMSPEERGFWFRQIHRAGSNANQRTMDNSGLWHSYIAVAASLKSQRHVPESLKDAWKRGEELLVERYKELYQQMAALFGFKLRGCYTWEQFDTAAAALAEGLCIRAGGISDHVDSIQRATGPGGEQQDWTLFAICFEGLLRQFFEVDEDSAFWTSVEHEAS